MPEVQGNLTGLGPQAHAALERITRRRVPADQIASPELVRSLAEASRLTKRQVGALVHRSGEIEAVIVGTATGLMLPDIGRLRAAEGRFRALRLVHTHLFGEPLTRDDLTDLSRLRLDLVAAVLLSPESEPRSFTWAYNIPTARLGDPSHQLIGPVPWGQPQPDFLQLIGSLEDEFARLVKPKSVEAKDGRAILVHVGRKAPGAADAAKAGLRELASLARTAGVEVADELVQLRDRIDPKWVLGRGKLDEVTTRAIELDAATLIFDHDLSPSQIGCIAAHTDLKVLDRTQLILDIFAQRAETRDGKLQVEVAQLKYTLPRLGTKDDALSRLTGGIGGRGPGETKLEIGRRRARERLTRLERELKDLERQRHERRRQRQRGDIPVIAIVGYTNAGKSTLLNTLTGAGVLAEDKLFATLDTRARKLTLPSGRNVILTDTVGFIRNMPKDLFAAFRATFEEAADADLLLELVDASDPEHSTHVAATAKLLGDLGLGAMPRLRVYNKLDRLGAEEALAFEGEDGAVTISALRRDTTRALLTAVEAHLDEALGALAAKRAEADAAWQRLGLDEERS